MACHFQLVQIDLTYLFLLSILSTVCSPLVSEKTLLLFQDELKKRRSKWNNIKRREEQEKQRLITEQLQRFAPLPLKDDAHFPQSQSQLQDPHPPSEAIPKEKPEDQNPPNHTEVPEGLQTESSFVVHANNQGNTSNVFKPEKAENIHKETGVQQGSFLNALKQKKKETIITADTPMKKSAKGKQYIILSTSGGRGRGYKM